MQAAVLEDPLGHAEGRAGGEQVRDHSGRGDHGGLQRDQQQEEAKAEHHADDQRRLRRECLLQVVVLGDRSTDHCARRQVGAQTVDRPADSGVGGVLLGDRLDQSEVPPGLLRRQHLRHARIGLSNGAGLRRPRPRGCDQLQRPGRAGPER